MTRLSPAAGQPRTTQIEEQFQMLFEALEIQEKTILEMIERVSPILAVQAPPSNGTVQAPQPVMVPMADRISDIVAKVNHNTSLVRATINRTEL